LSIIDVFSRYLISVPLRSKAADEVARAFVTNVVCQHGSPKWLVTDQGGEFVNATLKGVT